MDKIERFNFIFSCFEKTSSDVQCEQLVETFCFFVIKNSRPRKAKEQTAV